MGTFHDTTDTLHGMTVVARCGETVYIGRCHERDETKIVLLGADEHTEGIDQGTNAEYLAKAARYGIWTRHERLVLSTDQVEDLSTLSSHYRSDGRTTVRPAPATPRAKAAPTPDEPSPTPVALTDEARSEVTRLLAEQSDTMRGLRLGVSGGGCSGLVYKVEFDERRDGDLVIEESGFEIYLDPKSMIYLRGTVLDYQGGLDGRGFRFENPNASNTCGCGESFAV